MKIVVDQVEIEISSIRADRLNDHEWAALERVMSNGGKGGSSDDKDLVVAALERDKPRKAAI